MHQHVIQRHAGLAAFRQLAEGQPAMVRRPTWLRAMMAGLLPLSSNVSGPRFKVKHGFGGLSGA
ncbi:hypothetical protein [Paracoccus denitrificans]|jgi:hypothetical protein|uniref:hypothetical protein n=1 Tax=Paracoccus denitrificans TaxID=266 RepID=UPI000674F3AC|nr:hypothetical protein [Paracoccus denitrificans]MBB4628713.1 hypothetical protein [Paracoccus denitrificans]MCU7429852.1 hypothetical protein [Paracoccus denitrificans]UPV97879.1 hypothetical protein M0K93_17720 [Paracoccus denitrificans]